ncbi:MAG: hypothetical protein L6V88_11530 [Anaerotruncus sp.]|nr:MAG: hypothetical protein L6V88_11530 [Anaerotruncus sp.]
MRKSGYHQQYQIHLFRNHCFSIYSKCSGLKFDLKSADGIIYDGFFYVFLKSSNRLTITVLLPLKIRLNRYQLPIVEAVIGKKYSFMNFFQATCFFYFFVEKNIRHIL